MNRKLNVKYWLQLLIPRQIRPYRSTKYSNSPPEHIHDNSYFPGHGIDDISIALGAPSLYIPNAMGTWDVQITPNKVQ